MNSKSDSRLMKGPSTWNPGTVHICTHKICPPLIFPLVLVSLLLFFFFSSSRFVASFFLPLISFTWALCVPQFLPWLSPILLPDLGMLLLPTLKRNERSREGEWIWGGDCNKIAQGCTKRTLTSIPFNKEQFLMNWASQKEPEVSLF